MNSHSFLYLSQADVKNVDLGFGVVINLMEDTFRQKLEGKFEMPPKIGIHTRSDSFLHAMPAYNKFSKIAGMKWVGGYSENHKFKLPYITGLIILNNPETGLPIAVMDCAWITALRTGCVTALSGKYLAKSNSHTVGILACGLEGRTNLMGLAQVFELQTVFAYDISEIALGRFVDEMSSALNLKIVPVKTPEAAVSDSDLIVTAGPILKNPAPTILAEWLRPGVFASSVDFGSYWTKESLNKFTRIYTDDLEQYNYYKKIGYFADNPLPSAEIGILCTGKDRGRFGDDESYIAINLGLAITDVVVATKVYEKAIEMGIGTRLNF